MNFFGRRALRKRDKRDRQLASASEETKREALQTDLSNAKRTVDARTIASAYSMTDDEVEAALASDLRAMKQRGEYELFLARLPREEAQMMREIARKNGV